MLVVGDATQDLGGRLLALGARLVHVYDPDAERVRRVQTDVHASASAAAARAVVFRHLRDDELDVRDGAFDLVIVPDVAILADPTSLVARLRRVVDADGAVLVAARNPQSWDATEASETRVIDYYELYDIVSLQFSCVRMIGQVPFFGAAIAELGESDDEPDVSVHTELVSEAEPPEYFIALASHSDRVRLAPYAIVQLPRDAVSLSLGSTQEGVGAADRAVLVEATARVNLLETELEEYRAEIEHLRAEAGRSHRVTELEQAVYDATARIQQLEVDIDRRREHAAAFEEAMRTAEDAASSLEKRSLEAEQEALLRGEQCESLLAEVEALKASLQAERVASGAERVANEAERAAHEAERVANEAERAASEAERVANEAERVANEQRVLSDSEEVDRLLLQIGEHEEKHSLLEREFSQIAEAHGVELGALEARLVERGHRIAELERELGRREGITVNLVAELEERTAAGVAVVPEVAMASPTDPESSAKLEMLAEQNAEWGAKLEALAKENAAWSARLDEMAIDTARREGELHARTWRIAELEGELARNAYRAIDLERLARTEDELDILRRAIAQEHDARLRAESGEELTQARAELQRQAVLLEQLSRELDARDRAHAVQGSQEA